MKTKFYSSLAAFLTALMLILLLVFSNESAHEAKNALSMCAESIIPSLFVYIAISKFIISRDTLAPLYSRLPMKGLLKLPPASSQAVILGLLCGFPTGAECTKSLYESGKLTKKEAEITLAISSAASPTFLIGAVGGWYSKRYALVLLISNVVILFIYGKIRQLSLVGDNEKTAPLNKAREKKSVTVLESLADSISSASQSCLALTAYITFFSTVRAILSCLIPFLSPIFYAVFEFSSGAKYGALLANLQGCVITGFAVGFSSLSVFMQTYNIAEKAKISMRSFFYSKLLLGVGSAVISAAYFLLFPDEFMKNQAILPSYAESIPEGYVICTMFLLVMAWIVCKFCYNKISFSRTIDFWRNI